MRTCASQRGTWLAPMVMALSIGSLCSGPSNAKASTWTNVRGKVPPKPKFHEIVEELREFVQGAEVIIHNAPFDLGFLNHEFQRLGLPPFTQYCSGVIDTLVQAKELHPGKRNSLDALCDRYEISNAHRKLHGALLDSELLADVYLAMTRGQNMLSLDVGVEASAGGELMDAWWRHYTRPAAQQRVKIVGGKSRVLT